MTAGIAETFGRMATALIVVPVVLVGANFLIGGSLLVGVGFLGVAALMVAISEYVTRPSDLPGSAAGRVIDWIAKPPDDEE